MRTRTRRFLMLAPALSAALACTPGNDAASGPGSSGGIGSISSGGADTGSGTGNTGNTVSGSGGSPFDTGGAPSSGTSGGQNSGGTLGGGGATSVGSGGSTAMALPDLSHTFDPITIKATQEIPEICQSWTLNNDQPLYINKVVASNGGFFHHSNWIWVPDTNYSGPDGTWTCSDRGFDQILAGAVGGVFFAQSTQAKADTQAFPDGVAFQIPAHARIIGDVHLLNLTSNDATSSMSFDVYTLPAPDVHVQLEPLAYTNLSIDIAPQTTTHAHMQCAAPESDFDIYYVMPHYHVLGSSLEITVAGGPMDGQQIFQAQQDFGQSVGQAFNPPISVKGALGFGITCDYQNPRSATVKYGEGDQEMCVVLIYATGRKAGGETLGWPPTSITNTNGAHNTDSTCISIGQ